MKRALLLITFFLLLEKTALACISRDWQFTLSIRDLKLDTNKLENLCSEETCFVNEDLIAIKSHHDERVALIFGKTPSILGFRGLTVKLPYKIVDDVPRISSIDPETYNWKTSLKIDLNFLKKSGVLKISDEEIEKISSLAENGKNIMQCQDEWKVLEANCFCEDGEEICVKCFRESVQIPLPQKILEVSNKEGKDQNFPYILLIFITAFFLILISKSFFPFNLRNFKM